MKPTSLSPESLSELILYDPETGKFLWKKRDCCHFKDKIRSAEHCMKVWNKRYADTEALNSFDGDGYLHGEIFKRKYKSHQVAWALFYGTWPSNQIDHKDGLRSNNKITNLRVVDDSGNRKNSKLRVDNSTGYHGVIWCNRRNKWRVTVSQNRRNVHIGYFDDFDLAVEARKKSEIGHGYHENHGRQS